MDTSLPPFLATLAGYDWEFAELAACVRQKAVYSPGVLDVKTKVLIAFALDAARGLDEGVQLLAARARDAGATDAELVEVLKVLYSVGGLQGLSIGIRALNSDRADSPVVPA